MTTGNLNWTTNFMWGTADDRLPGLYLRYKTRDVILPITAPRPLANDGNDRKRGLNAAEVAPETHALAA